MNEKELRRLLEKIEYKYLHLSKEEIDSSNSLTVPFKFTAAQKYVQVCTELIKSSDSFSFADVDTLFTLIVKPASSTLEYLQEKKDPDTLDIFFLSLIEFFEEAYGKAEEGNLEDEAHKCRLMCIDAHKIRLLASKSIDKDAITFTVSFINGILERFPWDGRYWFQFAIIQFTFLPEFTSIKSFKSLDSLCRAILSKKNPITLSNAALLLSKRISVDFGSTLLNMGLNDFKDFASKDLQTWSFVKYFQSFSDCADFSRSELAGILLFVISFYHLSENSYHLRIFFESFLDAKNLKISEFWPFVVLCILKLTLKSDFKPSDAIWFKIFQLLKLESFHPNSLVSTNNYESFFVGTFLDETFTSTSLPFYDFDEEFSLERDNLIIKLTEFFDFKSGPFNDFITLRQDKTLRLGRHFCEKDSSSEEERELENIRADNSKLDNSIEELRFKLASLSSNSQIETTTAIDYLNNVFIIDTNVLLAGSPVIRSELSQRPQSFLIPLVVLSEIFKLSKLKNEKSSYAQNAFDFIDPLLKSSLNVYNNYGRLLRPEEISQQLAVLTITRTKVLNDDQIILLANQYHQKFPLVPKPILITEDLIMRLKAKSKSIMAISIKEFRNICNC